MEHPQVSSYSTWDFFGRDEYGIPRSLSLEGFLKLLITSLIALILSLFVPSGPITNHAVVESLRRNEYVDYDCHLFLSFSLPFFHLAKHLT